MTELLAKALDRIQDLPEDAQDRVARLILDEVETYKVTRPRRRYGA